MIIHTGIETGRWFKFSIVEQLANIGMEVERTIYWKRAGNKEYSDRAFERALELMDFTKMDPKNRGPRLKEICRVREVLVDYFMYDNIYQSTDKLWQDYFYGFNYAAALQRGR